MRSDLSGRHEEPYSIPTVHRWLASLSQPDVTKARLRGRRQKQNHGINEYTVMMEPPTNRSKRKHTSQRSDPPPKTKTVAQSYLTAYTSCTGKQTPSTVLFSTFLTSERPAPSRGAISTGNRTHRPPPPASPHSLQKTKSNAS
jgi:hypothetical protein